MTNKLTKLQKHLNEQGIEFKVREYSDGDTTLTFLYKGVWVMAKDMKSTIYHSIRGRKGKAAGFYMELGNGYMHHYPSQAAMIEKLQSITMVRV